MVSNYFFLKQDEKNLDWRIKSNPYPNNYFELISKNSEGQIVGSIICNLREVDVAYIEQMSFCDSLEDSLKIELINSALNLIKSEKSISIIRFWGFSHNSINNNEIKLLSKCGFLFINKGTSFVYYPLNDNSGDCKYLIVNRLYTQGNI